MLRRRRDEHEDIGIDWETVQGTVIENLDWDAQRKVTVFVVQIHPEGRDPIRTEVTSPPNMSDEAIGFRAPDAGEVVRCLFDPVSGEVRPDLTDTHFSLINYVPEGESSFGFDRIVTGPPWIVPELCPDCGARVEQATARLELSPTCAYCKTPLPVQPQS